MDHGTAHGSDHAHPSYVQHHFDSAEQQFESGKLGMWIFLVTEVLLFSGLFCAYAIYRANHYEIFEYAHQFLDKTLGGINTVVLLSSSFTMAWAVRAAQLGKRRALVVLLSLTLLGGLGFMGIKYVEYRHKWQHGLLWGQRYESQAAHAGTPEEIAAPASATIDAAAPSANAAATDAPRTEPILVPQPGSGPPGTVLPHNPTDAAGAPAHRPGSPSNVHIFFGIYFVMTGLHGLHVLAGMGAIGWLLFRALAGHFSTAYNAPVDLVGLYWHLVDLIWIFLFPLLYLIH